MGVYDFKLLLHTPLALQGGLLRVSYGVVSVYVRLRAELPKVFHEHLR